jgi:hypothetical protein
MAHSKDYLYLLSRYQFQEISSETQLIHSLATAILFQLLAAVVTISLIIQMSAINLVWCNTLLNLYQNWSLLLRSL